MDAGTATRSHRYQTAAVVVVVTMLARLRYLWVPISSDESGYLAVGRAWSRGARLYDTIWIDRQQGLLVLFRFLHQVGLGTPMGVRALAIAAGCVAALSIGSIGASLAGEPARLYCGLAAAVLLGIGQIEGFEANAELLSGAVGAAGLALVLSRRSRASRWPLYGAGLVSGYALMTKQSAFDSMLAATAVLTWGWWRHRTARPAQAVAAYLGGVVTTVGLAALHGTLTGWRRWWFALAGYRFTYRSVLSNADWSALRTTAGIVSPILAFSVILAAVVVVAEHRRVRAETWLVLAVWLAAAVVSFLIGGLYYRHYWMILIFPLSTLIGIAVSLLRTPLLRSVGVALALVLPIVYSVDLMRLPGRQVGDTLGDRRWAVDVDVGRWITEHSTTAADRVLVICNGVGLYGNIQSDPPYPYLWAFHIHDIPGAQDLMATTLARRSRPRFVAVYNRFDWCDPSGATETQLRRHYLRSTRVGFVEIYTSRA